MSTINQYKRQYKQIITYKIFHDTYNYNCMLSDQGKKSVD